MSIGGHHNPRSKSNEWMTPPFIIEALGGFTSFDLDPAAAAGSAIATAQQCYTRADNGLLSPWFGRVWLNPPYSNPAVVSFMRRMADHNRGTALIFARTETQMFFETVWRRASACLFFSGRLNFHHLDGRRASANAGAPSVLCAYGTEDMDILAAANLDGQFVPLRLPRSVVMAALSPSWREVVAGWVGAQDGPVRLDELYQAFARHPKAAANQHWRAKIRQILQQGPYRRTGRGEWAPA